MSILDEIYIDHQVFQVFLQKVGFSQQGEFLILVEDFERDLELFPVTFAWKDGECTPYICGANIRHGSVIAWTLDDIRSFMYDVYKKCISQGYKIYRPDLNMYNPYINIGSQQQLIDYIKQKTSYYE